MQTTHKNQYLKDFDYDDGGEDYNWSSTRIILPEGEDPT